ncbi:Copia protein [Senna tora]|uniref:Copia protein n=1 Tax=Senna tora TaxID=362788 RepID=A0A834SG78_9FABA|nr:Copia protein [Senna tora]
MAKEADEEELEVAESSIHFDELLETYNTLLEDSRKILEKYGELKISQSKVLKAFSSLKLEKEALEEKIKTMEEEYSMSALILGNRKLKATIDKLNYDLGQFVKGKNNLNLILGNQKSLLDKRGLGYTGSSSGKKVNKEQADNVEIRNEKEPQEQVLKVPESSIEIITEQEPEEPDHGAETGCTDDQNEEP